MRITDLLEIDCIEVPLKAKSKEEAIRRLTTLAARRKNWSRVEDICATVIEREGQAGSTDFQEQLAFPHATSPLVKRKCMAIGKLENPIAWGGPSGQSVSIVFLLLGPDDQIVGDVLLLLDGLFRNDTSRNLLLHCNSATEIYNFMTQVGVDLEIPQGFDLTHFVSGHSDVIQALAWSPDGSCFASAARGTDHAILVWHTQQSHSHLGAKIAATLHGHGAPVNTLAWSRDHLASAGEDKTIRVWSTNLSMPDVDTTVIDVGVEIHGLAWSPDEQILAAAQHLQGVGLYRIDGKRVGTLERIPDEPLDPTLAIAWSRKSNFIAAAGGRVAPGIHIWDAASSHRLVKKLSLSNGHIPSLTWSPSGDILCAGLLNGSIARWNTSDWSRLPDVREQSLGITCLDFSCRGDYLASKSADGTVCIWDTSEWLCKAVLSDDDTYPRVYAPTVFHPTDLKLASLGGQGRSIRVWRLSPQYFSLQSKELLDLNSSSPLILKSKSLTYSLPRAERHQFLLGTLSRFRAITRRLAVPKNEKEFQSQLWVLVKAIFPDASDERHSGDFAAVENKPDFKVPSAHLLIDAKYIKSNDRNQLRRFRKEVSEKVVSYLQDNAIWEELLIVFYDEPGLLSTHPEFLADFNELSRVTVVIAE